MQIVIPSVITLIKPPVSAPDVEAIYAHVGHLTKNVALCKMSCVPARSSCIFDDQQFCSLSKEAMELGVSSNAFVHYLITTVSSFV